MPASLTVWLRKWLGNERLSLIIGSTLRRRWTCKGSKIRQDSSKLSSWSTFWVSRRNGCLRYDLARSYFGWSTVRRKRRGISWQSWPLLGRLSMSRLKGCQGRCLRKMTKRMIKASLMMVMRRTTIACTRIRPTLWKRIDLMEARLWITSCARILALLDEALLLSFRNWTRLIPLLGERKCKKMSPCHQSAPVDSPFTMQKAQACCQRGKAQPLCWEETTIFKEGQLCKLCIVRLAH